MKRAAPWTVLIAALVVVTAPALAQQPQTSARPAAQTQATWWGHAAWIIETPGGARIAIDPWLDESPGAQGGQGAHAAGRHPGDARPLRSRR